LTTAPFLLAASLLLPPPLSVLHAAKLLHHLLLLFLIETAMLTAPRLPLVPPPAPKLLYCIKQHALYSTMHGAERCLLQADHHNPLLLS
jgi:hypothetical protein